MGLNFFIFERYPIGFHLDVHLKNGKRVFFTPEHAAQRAVSLAQTTLIAYCTEQGKVVDGHANLFSTDALGRIYTLSANNDKCFYLRLLLINVRGPSSFQQLQQVHANVCSTVFYHQFIDSTGFMSEDYMSEDTLRS